MAAEAHAEAEVSAVVVLAEVHEAVEASVAALLVVHTVVVSEAHTMEAHLVVTMVDISEDIIMLPHPHIITIITAHTFGARSDHGVVPMLVVAVAVLLLLSVSFYSL